MKKIDRYLISSFIPPFIATFFISLFVLIMVFLWTYIDDMVGKGASIFFIIEIIFYASITFFPLAFPIAILISSVMVMGNLAERYELASLKSAGVPLLRIMQPLIFIAAILGVCSFISSNYLIPVANLKFKSRLYDIKKQKPTLSMEEGVFNEDFQGFIIHIGAKDDDNKTIRDVLIYDHKSYTDGRINQIMADHGEMYLTEDQRFFVMNLFDGWQYQETTENKNPKEKTYPFIRTSFKEWSKVFDLSEFDMNHTDDNLFKSHRTMLNIRQLGVAIDSIRAKFESRNKSFKKQADNFYSFRKVKWKELEAKERKDRKQDHSDETNDKRDSLNVRDKYKSGNPSERNRKSKSTSSALRKIPRIGKILEQKLDKDITEYKSLLLTFPKSDQKRLLSKATATTRSIHGHAKSLKRYTVKETEQLAKFIYEKHFKIAMAVVCVFFLFIGAPMGAIVRKGGFGWPLLIAILFFLFFMVLTMFCDSFAEKSVLPAALAAWLPSLIIFPIGIFLTTKAMNDSKIINTDGIKRVFAFIQSLLSSRKKVNGADHS